MCIKIFKKNEIKIDFNSRLSHSRESPHILGPCRLYMTDNYPREYSDIYIERDCLQPQWCITKSCGYDLQDTQHPLQQNHCLLHFPYVFKQTPPRLAAPGLTRTAAAKARQLRPLTIYQRLKAQPIL